MKKCPYCGRDNSDEALNCRECGTEFESSGDAPVQEEPTQAGSSLSEYQSELSGALKKIASLEVDAAADLLSRLQKENISAQVKTLTAEGGLEYSDILVQDSNFERACDVAEAWEAERFAEAEKRSNRFCPRCGSRHLEYVGTDRIGIIWKCKNCGNDFAK